MSSQLPNGQARPPAPGERGTRSPQSCAEYLAKASQMTRRAARELSLAAPTPQEVAAHVIALKPEWSKSTWRYIKSALIYAWEEQGGDECAAAIQLLAHQSQSECLKTSLRTSGRRAKAFSDTDLHEVLRGIRTTRSQYAPVLSTWVLLGNQVGIRPHEWGMASVIRTAPASIGDLHFEGQDGDVPYLRIRNAKATNGRTHGEFRHLNLSGLAPALVESIERFAQMMGSIVEAGSYRRTYESCSRLLRRVNSEIHKNDSERWIQLYSPRHRFSSLAKLHLTQEETAALLGHATTRTAEKHYGKRRSASGSMGARPVAMEVDRIRAVRNYQAAAIARAKAGPGSSGK